MMIMKMIIIDLLVLSRNDGFSRAPDIDFRYEIEARKAIVYFKLDALA